MLPWEPFETLAPCLVADQNDRNRQALKKRRIVRLKKSRQDLDVYPKPLPRSWVESEGSLRVRVAANWIAMTHHALLPIRYYVRSPWLPWSTIDSIRQGELTGDQPASRNDCRQSKTNIA